MLVSFNFQKLRNTNTSLISVHTGLTPPGVSLSVVSGILLTLPKLQFPKPRNEAKSSTMVGTSRDKFLSSTQLVLNKCYLSNCKNSNGNNESGNDSQSAIAWN